MEIADLGAEWTRAHQVAAGENFIWRHQGLCEVQVLCVWETRPAAIVSPWPMQALKDDGTFQTFIAYFLHLLHLIRRCAGSICCDKSCYQTKITPREHRVALERSVCARESVGANWLCPWRNNTKTALPTTSTCDKLRRAPACRWIELQKFVEKIQNFITEECLSSANAAKIVLGYWKYGHFFKEFV